MSYSPGQLNHSLHAGIAITKGLVQDLSGVDKFGYNSDVGTSYETIWDGGSTYAYPSSATTMTATSAASATDNGVEVTIIGLDSTWNPATATVTLAGSGTATTTQTFIRVFRAYVDNGQEPTGNITIGNGGTTYAQITFPYNQTLMAVYTIPAGHNGYLVSANISIEKQKEVVAKLMFRPYNSIFTTKGIISSFGVPYQRNWLIPPLIPAKTDIEIRAKAGASTGISAGFEIILEKT